eukprot:gnl/Spiro4/6753_TR3487_c0_g1_i1.p2 gnl/Spiro4/6753_TR3487_c0_g1~~gnl/Spiro4/6753_TR3487_c0_g1_i1.p2  ORF type:complete len:224 (-),score=13.23 gnl/Spiro4/6753_TR3487_c0_g1_i1:733-1404(-)
MQANDLFQRALDLYSAPFTFNKYGYLNDSSGQMVADNHVEDSVEETGKEAVLRVRGWGRISYLPDPEKLQDQVGEIIGQALTAYWLKHRGVESLKLFPTPTRYDINGRGERVEREDGEYVRIRDYNLTQSTLNGLVEHVREQEEVIQKLKEELAEANTKALREDAGGSTESRPVFTQNMACRYNGVPKVLLMLQIHESDEFIEGLIDFGESRAWVPLEDLEPY